MNNILIIHGDDTEKSYQRFIEVTQKAKDKGWEVENSLDNLRSSSLFTKKRAFILYFDKSLPQNFLKKLTKEAKIEEFKPPKIIFTFLDSFYPRNAKSTLKLFHQIIKTQAPEFVLAFLARHLRDLYWTKNDLSTLSYPSWRLVKLKKQLSLYKEGELANMISLLAQADVKAKISTSSLVDSLDLIVASKLQ